MGYVLLYLLLVAGVVAVGLAVDRYGQRTREGPPTRGRGRHRA